MTFREYDSLEEAWADMKRAEEHANANLHPLNQQVVYGSYWMRPVPEIGVLVFGYVMTREENETSEREAGSVPEELEYTMHVLDDSYRRGYRYGKAYSVIEPEGEYGSTHIANMWPISKEEFDLAKEQGWLLEQDQYVAILERLELI